MASEITVNTASPTPQQQTTSDIAPQVADSQTELHKQLLLLRDFGSDDAILFPECGGRLQTSILFKSIHRHD